MSTRSALFKPALLLSLSAPSLALAGMPGPSSPMPLGPATYAPQGFVDFCRKLPQECAPAAPADVQHNETGDRIAEIIAQVQGATSSIGAGPPSPGGSVAFVQDDAPVSGWLRRRPLKLIPDRITVIARGAVIFATAFNISVHSIDSYRTLGQLRLNHDHRPPHKSAQSDSCGLW